MFVVAKPDLAIFTLGVLPDDAKGRERAVRTAQELATALAGRRMGYGEAGQLMGVHHNSLRYAAATGTVLIRWEGPGNRPCGPCRRLRGTPTRPAGSWRDGTCTSTDRPHPRPSATGRG